MDRIICDFPDHKCMCDPWSSECSRVPSLYNPAKHPEDYKEKRTLPAMQSTPAPMPGYERCGPQ